MNEENLNQTEEVVEGDVSQYVDTIKQLKANSVSRTQYDKLKNENKELLNAILNGESNSVVAEPVKKRSYIEIGKELAGTDWCTNKEFLHLSEEFREAMIEQKGVDPWTFCGLQNNPTDEVYDTAEAIEEFMNQMHEYDDCDSRTYCAQINNRIPPARGYKKK